MAHLRVHCFQWYILVAVLALGWTSSGTRISAQDTSVVRVGVIPSDIAGEAYYAQEMGFFRKEGLTVEISPMVNGGATSTALVAQAIDIGYTGTVEVMNAKARGIDLTILADANDHLASAPTAALLSVVADSPIRTAKDLSGKTIAVSPLRGTTYVTTRAWIDKNGGDSSQVRFVEMPLQLMADAVKSGRVDAAAFDTLADPTLGKPGDAFRLLGCTFDAIAPRWSASEWITTDTWVAKHPLEAKKFVAAMRETAIWANAHHAESAQILAKYTKLTVAQLQSATRVTYGTDMLPASIQPFIDAAAKYGIAPAAPGAELISPAAR